jgi:hypothetical protein
MHLFKSNKGYQEKIQWPPNKSNYDNYSECTCSSLMKVTKKKIQWPPNKSNCDNYNECTCSSLTKVTKKKYSGQLTKVAATTAVNVLVQVKK